MHQEGQASRKEDIWGHWLAMLLMPGTQVRGCGLRGEGSNTEAAAQASWSERWLPALLTGTARTMQMALVPPGNHLVPSSIPSLCFAPTTSPSLPPSSMFPALQAALPPRFLWEQRFPMGSSCWHHSSNGELDPSALPSPSAGKVRAFPFISRENK